MRAPARADEALLADDKAVQRVKDMTVGGDELVLYFLGVNSTLQMAAQMARILGHLTIVGLTGGALPLNFFRSLRECSVASTLGARSLSSWK